MTPQQIKANAPEGATHYRYIVSGNWLKYIKIVDNSVWIWNGVKWRVANLPELFLNNPVIKPL